MKLVRGDRIKMTTKREPPEPDHVQYGKVLADEGGGRFIVATDQGPTLIWTADDYNTEKIDEE